MSQIKRFGKYIIWIMLFWILSDILIYAGINSTYKDMENKGDNIPGIEVVQMQSTKVNGRIKLKLKNPEFSGKYLKIDLYSDIGNRLGTQYINIGQIKENQVKDIETYFKMTDIKSYEISITEEARETTVGFDNEEMSKFAVLTLLAYMVFF